MGAGIALLNGDMMKAAGGCNLAKAMRRATALPPLTAARLWPMIAAAAIGLFAASVGASALRSRNLWL